MRTLLSSQVCILKASQDSVQDAAPLRGPAEGGDQTAERQQQHHAHWHDS